MTLEHDVDYDSREKLIDDLTLTYRNKVRNANSIKEVSDAIEPLLINLSVVDRGKLGRVLSFRMLQWDRENIPKGRFDNPYTGIAFHLDPLARQD